MRSIVIGIGLVFALAAVNCWAAETGKEPQKVENPVVLMKTSLGDMKIELWADKAPETVRNFLGYVDDKFYDGTIFHRVIPNFMIQGGGFTPDMNQKPTKGKIKNEASPALKNVRGTLAMARLPGPHTATAQFFINVVNNDFLDQKDKTDRGFGYCVFGKVTEGLDVLDKIKAVPTKTVGGFDDVPVKPVVIQSITRVAAK
jgi:peptidyl-prolyl cis-trans isomerase B (cyclophilin B)